MKKVQNIKVQDLAVGQDVTIRYTQPNNGAGSLRWKTGVVESIGPKWVALQGHRGGWVPVDGVAFITLFSN